MRVLFLCDDNVCSSSMAAGFLYHQARLRSIDNLVVASAGFASAGQPINSTVIGLLEDRGVDGSRKRTRQVDAEIIGRADLTITMTVAQARRAELAFPEIASRIFTLRHLCELVVTRPEGIGAHAWIRDVQRTNVREYAVADTSYDIAEPSGEEFGAVFNLADQLLGAIDHLVSAVWPRASIVTR